MVMDGMQALCGTERPGEGRAFWDGLRKSGKRGIQTDLREGERLCAIAYVKRRFVHYFGDHFQAEMPEKWYANGWKLEPNAVSVVALAAKPWLENAEKNPAAQTTLREFYNAARVLSGESETTTEDYDWPSVEELAFYEADLRSSKLYPDREQAGRTLQALVALQQAAGLGAPSPYYALLLMDGDSLGKHMGKPTKRGLISEALNLFTSQAQEIVEQNRSGFLVYAGGDDVLALLALDDALPCAVALRSAYEAAFNQAKANAEARGEPAVEEFPATISAAIQFAHYRLPFTKILGDAHQLLDEVAKDGRGRDALAVRVWKLSGLHLTWAQPWDVALVEQGSGATANPDGQVWLAKLACALSTRPLDTVRPDPVEGRVSTGSTRTEAVDSKAGLDVANGFFYRLRERFALLKPKDSQAEGIEEEDMVKLMAYEYRHSGIHEGKMTQHDAEDLIKPLLQQCQPKYREEAKDSKPPQFKFTFEPDKPKRHQADAALLVRFLASHGNER
jgi:CRISPR-associated protein Cmr2